MRLGPIALLVCGAFMMFMGVLGGAYEQQVAQCAPSLSVAGSTGATGRDANPGTELDLLHMPQGTVVSVAATTYGGDFGSIGGAEGQLARHPDTFAELSTLNVNPYPNFTFNNANALGVLPYMTGLRVRHNGRSMVLYKRDIGFGQGTNTLDGHRARLDIYAPAAQALGVSYNMVDISLARRGGSGNVLDQTPFDQDPNILNEDLEQGDASDLTLADVRSYLQGRSGHVAFAVAQPDGTLVVSDHGDEQIPNASLLRTMALVALLREHKHEKLSPTIRDRAVTMMTGARADAQAAMRDVVAHLARDTLTELAHDAHMAHFALPTTDLASRFADMAVTAGDQARLFASLDQLLPHRHEAWALGLLGTGEANDWGIADAGIPGSVYAGIGEEAMGQHWRAHQAAQIGTPSSQLGIAILTEDSPDGEYAHATVREVASSLVKTEEIEGCADVMGQGPLPLAPGSRAKILPDGRAAAPEEAPEAVKRIIAAANQIIHTPYVWGGGHGVPLNKVISGYDCSGSVSHALGGAGLLESALVSGALMSFGDSGPGEWVTIEASPSHVYMYVAGLRFDTSRVNDPGGESGPRWRPQERTNAGFTTRHPEGL